MHLSFISFKTERKWNFKFSSTHKISKSWMYNWVKSKRQSLDLYDLVNSNGDWSLEVERMNLLKFIYFDKATKYMNFKILDKIKCNFRRCFIVNIQDQGFKNWKIVNASIFSNIYLCYSLKFLRKNQFELGVFKIMTTQKEPIIFFPFANLAWTN